MTIANGVALGLAAALFTTAPPMERREVGDARAGVSFSGTGLGRVRLEFATLAPIANADGIRGANHSTPGNPWVVHRILMDTERGLYYGYDIEISKGGGPGEFVAAIKPLAPEVEQEFRERRWSDFCRACVAPRPVASAAQRFPEPRAVTAGDTLAIDLLSDERNGALVTDRVTFALPRRAKPQPVFPPEDLKPDVVWIQMADATLQVNGKPAWNEDTGGSAQGDVLWTEIPDRGRVFVSLVPRPGYEFKKVGVVAGDRITFAIDGDRYEWISTGPIVTAGPVPPFKSVQSWYVWVLHDAGYRSPGGVSRGTVGAGFDFRAENRLKSS